MNVSKCPFKSLLGNQIGGLAYKQKITTPPLSDRFIPSQAGTFKELQKGDRKLQLKFIGLEEKDIMTLTRLKPLIEKNVGEIVNHFYN